MKAELTLGLRTAEEHTLPRHAQAIKRQQGFASGYRRDYLRRDRQRIQRRARQPEPGRPPSDDERDSAEHVRQQHVLAAEYVTLAYLAAHERGDMSGGDVIDMHEV